MITIGIQGGKGSFSEQAAQEFAHNHGLEGAEIVYQISSEQVLSGVESGETDFGIFAMENAQGGVVIESVEALAKYRCDIIEMFHIPIMCLHLPILALSNYVNISGMCKHNM